MSSSYYSFFYSGSNDSIQRAAFIDSFLQRTEEQSVVLDTSAGNGEIAMELAKLKNQVFALETDEALFSVILERLSLNRELRPYFAPFPISSRDFPLSHFANLVYASNTLSHLNDEDTLEILANSSRFLVKEGKLIVNFPVPHLLRKEQHEYELSRKIFGNTIIKHVCKSKIISENCMQIDFRFESIYKNQTICLKTSNQLIYIRSPENIVEYLNALDFKIDHILGGWSHESNMENSPNCVIVASKK